MKNIAVLAGDYGQFVTWVRERDPQARIRGGWAHGVHAHYEYISAWRHGGVEYDEVQVVGTFHQRSDAKQLEEAVRPFLGRVK